MKANKMCIRDLDTFIASSQYATACAITYKVPHGQNLKQKKKHNTKKDKTKFMVE